MAGTLTISTLSDGTNSTSSTNCIQGSAKAWANFNSSGTIAASYNVSSVTKNSTGRWTVNFTNALADANYSTTYSPLEGAANGSIGFIATGASYSTTAVSVACNQASNGAAYDSNKNCVAVFR